MARPSPLEACSGSGPATASRPPSSSTSRKRFSFPLHHGYDPVRGATRKALLASARPSHVDLLHRGLGAQPEMQPQIAAGEITPCASLFLYPASPARSHGNAGANGVAIRLRSLRNDA